MKTWRSGLVRAFGGHYDQILLVGDPLFLKKLTDRARNEGVDWSRYRINVVIGEEIFGEHFRTYLATCLGLDVDRPQNGYIMSSFGVGELGLHLCYETPATIAVHRAASTDQELARELLAAGDGATPPMIFAFNPLRPRRTRSRPSGRAQRDRSSRSPDQSAAVETRTSPAADAAIFRWPPATA